jgi:hypothetical protein
MHRIMGLPLDRFYEEFIPHYHERDPSMLLYLKCLAQLFAVWDELQVGGDVSLQEWCDYFHNGPGGSLHPDNTESLLVYKAAFFGTLTL